MKLPPFLACLGLVFLAPTSRAQPATAPAPSPANETAPVHDAIVDPLHNPAWQDLFTQLAPARSRLAQFEERRFFPFRKTPTVLTGEIRMQPGHGLSLHYLTPADRIVIVDSQGVLMRDPNGRERAAPNDSRAQAVSSALFSVLRFDVAALQNSFDLRGRRDGSQWVLVFVPHDRALTDLIGDITVYGHNAILDRIVMQKSEAQRIEIALHDTRENVTFAGDVLDRYFR